MKKFATILLLIFNLKKGFCATDEELQAARCERQIYSMHECCHLPPMDHDVVVKCSKEFKGRSFYSAILCFQACMYTEMGLLSAEGQLDREKLKEQNEDFFYVHQDEDLKVVMHEAIEECLKRYDEKESTILEDMKQNNYECNYIPHILDACISFMVTQKCIDLTIWSNATICDLVVHEFQNKDECEGLDVEYE